MTYEINGVFVMKVEEVTTKTQTATVKTYYDQLYHLQVTTDKASITADGVDTATITAEVYDYENNKVVDQNPVVIFEIDGATVDVQTVNGQAQTTVTASTAGTITIKAIVQDYRGGEVSVNAE